MPLKTFLSRDGTSWSVWRVDTSSGAAVPGTPSEWLAFQDSEATERRRLFEIPPNWEDLPDERLELLCRLAEPARLWSRPSPPAGIERIEESTGADRKD